MLESAARFGAWLSRVSHPQSRRVRVAAVANARALVLDLALIAAVCALLWLGVRVLLEQQRRDLLLDAAQDNANLAQAFEENTLRTVDAIDLTLLFLRSAYVRSGGDLDLAAWNRQTSRQERDGITFQLGIIGANGQLLASSLGPVTSSIDLSDREHFRVQRASTTDALFVSKPVLGRKSGRWSLQFARKILGPDGSFDGVAVISVDPIKFAELYALPGIERGSVLLAGLDGAVRAEAPASVAGLGRDIASSPLLTAAKAAAKGTICMPEAAGGRQIVSFRRLDRYGFVLAVGLDRDGVLVSYATTRIECLAAGGLLTLLILFAGGSIVRRRQALLRSQLVLTDTLENMSQGILMVDSDRSIAVINRRAVELLGLPPGLIKPGSSFDDLLQWQLQNGEFDDDEQVRRLAESGGLEITDSAYERIRPNGTALEVRSRRLSHRRAVRTFADVTERKQAEAQITHLAHHDGLTGLANRRSFQDRLAHAISLSRRSGAPFAVLCLDLDCFKQVNDTRGHDVGDLLLQGVADRLRASVRDGDTVTRSGGDEFAILQTDAGQPTAAAALAERLVATLAQPFELRGAQTTIGASIGVALFPADGLTAEQLLKSADIALYGAKEAGRSTFRFFEPEMDMRLQERCALERDFSEALASGRIEVHFQPICNIATSQPVCYEALARWTHPERGVVSPSVFIPLAEEIGLIPALGRFVLRAACEAAVTWPASIRLAVNLSPLQFIEPDMAEQICECLHEAGLEPRRLDLEVTEGLLIRNAEAALDAIGKLRQQGVRVYLDDFGSGHAGLTYLLRFPFDGIKVDRAFVAKLDTDRASQAIIRAAMLFSEHLQLSVIAEGVETEAQLESLRAFGCHQAQGFLLGRPRPGHEISHGHHQLADLGSHFAAADGAERRTPP